MWDKYWDSKGRMSKVHLYIIASFYRNYLIKPTLINFIRNTFSPHANSFTRVAAVVGRYRRRTLRKGDSSRHLAERRRQYLASQVLKPSAWFIGHFHLSRLGRRFDGFTISA